MVGAVEGVGGGGHGRRESVQLALVLGVMRRCEMRWRGRGGRDGEVYTGTDGRRWSSAREGGGVLVVVPVSRL